VIDEAHEVATKVDIVADFVEASSSKVIFEALGRP
jgi:hypothetical protein